MKTINKIKKFYNKNITAKFLGGYKFDFDSVKSMDWGKFPKGYFFLPEYIISYNNKKTWLTIIKKINTDFNIQTTIFMIYFYIF